MPKRHLTPEERRAWAKVARSVKPLRSAQPASALEDELNLIALEDVSKAPMKKKKAHVPPTQMAALTRGMGAEKTSPPKRPPAPIDRAGERRVRRGQAPIAGRLDLHGHTQETAHGALLSFLQRQSGAGARCVLVITGKGKAGGGILRARFLDWLASGEIRPLVSGYAAAHRKHGGSGAWYVFLRAR